MTPCLKIYIGPFLLIFTILLFASCSSDKKSAFDEMPPLYSTPQSVAFNTNEGYIINPVTGDSIEPITNSSGDTIRTGVPVPVKGKIIHPDSVGQAVIMPAGKPHAIPLSNNVFKIPESLTIIPVEKDRLRTFTPGVDTPSFVLVHPSGDTIPTGIPIPTKGKVVPCVQPQSVNALPPSMRKDAKINIKYLDEPQGMPSSYIQSIIEDRQGNLWFGTFDEGVIKYNGKTFTHFTEKEGLSNNYLSSMLEDSHGNLWFGTVGGGMCMYNGETFTHFSHGEGLINTNILCMMLDSHNNIWFGTEGGGAAKYNGKTITHFTTKEGLQNNNVLSIMEDKQGNIWFGTERGASKYNGELFTHFDNRDGLQDTITSILEDRQGNIWFGTNRGVYKYNGEAFIHFYEKEGFIIEPVKTIFEDSHDNIWFGTVGGGVIMYSGKTFTHITWTQGLTCHFVNSILEDSHGNIWFATNTGGVNIYSKVDFTYLSYAEGLSHNYVASITEDSQGNLWFGTGWRLSKFNEKSFTNFDISHGLSDLRIFSALEDCQGNLWFGTREGGVNKYNGKSFTHFTEKEGLSNNWVWSGLEDSQGNLWFGTKGGGVSKYNGAIFTHYTEKEGLSNNDIRSIAEDSQGNIWFGTYGSGVSKYNGETIIHITEKEGLGSNLIHCIFEDSHGNLWFGTEGGGVSIFNGETFIHITEKEGLSDNCAWSIMEDNNGNIWVGARNGLNYLDVGSNNVFRNARGLYTSEAEEDSSEAAFCQPAIHTYSMQDGLKQKRIIERCMHLDSKNRIWMGNSGVCLIMLDMNNFKPSVEPPKMQLERIEINEQFTDYRQLKDSPGIEYDFTDVAKYHNYPLNLELPYNNNHLTFHFSAIDWSAPHKIKYCYKMVGLDKEWSKPTPKGIADYRRLPFGNYTFKVKSIGTAQKWSDTFEYTFTIHPPWWFRWWVIVIECLLACSLLISIIRSRERNLKQRAMILEQKVQEKTQQILEQRKEVDEMKSRFYTNISHEFRTPLTLLVGPLEDYMKTEHEDFTIKRKIIVIMLRNARRLQRLINQLLDVSKLETGKMKLQVSDGDFTGFVRTLVLSFLSLAESKRIKYTYNLPQTSAGLFFDPDKLEKILINLISNAFKFTPEGGVIDVRLDYFTADSETVTAGAVGPVEFAEIKISDTGKGIPADKLDLIFNRFYQVSKSDTREQEGSGIGLALTRELVNLYRGKIHVRSEIGQGSTFTLRLPVSKESFKKGEIVEAPFLSDSEPEKGVFVSTTPDRSGQQEEQTVFKGKDEAVILIVEDNMDLRDYISRNLVSRYQILEAENGREGLHQALELIPDMVITDLMMPEMDGMEMCRRLKEDERTSHIPVIMLTAKADRESKLKGLETGADDYLIKPFDQEELQVRTRNLIEQRRKLREKFQKEFRIKPIEETMGVPGDKLLHKVLDIFQQHIDDPQYNVDHLTGELNMSRSQMYRKIRALTGSGPGDLLRIIRMKKAAELILKGKFNIAQIMYEVGFQSPAYFAKTFREYYGVNPSKYKGS